MTNLPQKKLLQLFLFVALLLVTQSNAFAQFRDVPPKYEEFGSVCLLGFPSVVEHLKADYDLAEENVQALQALGKNRLKNMHLRRDFRYKTSKMNDKQFDKARTELFKTIEKSNAEAWTKAKELLDEKQVARLQQLRIQRLGPAALMDSEVTQVLALKGEPLKKHLKSAMVAKQAHDESLLKLKADLLAERRDKKFTPQSREDREWNIAFSKKLAEAKISERDKAFATVLDDQQQFRLASLTGTPFVFKLDFDFPKIKVDWQIDLLKETKD